MERKTQGYHECVMQGPDLVKEVLVGNGLPEEVRFK